MTEKTAARLPLLPPAFSACRRIMRRACPGRLLSRRLPLPALPAAFAQSPLPDAISRSPRAASAAPPGGAGNLAAAPQKPQRPQKPAKTGKHRPKQRQPAALPFPPAQPDGSRRWALAFILGILAALALPPFYLVPLCFISFPLLVLLLDSIAPGAAPVLYSGRHWRAAAAIGWFFGFGYFTAGLWWLANAMTVDIGQFGWAIPLAAFGLPAFLAGYYALAAALAIIFWRRGLPRIVSLSLSFTLAEYLRGVLFTGFPWNALGYTAMPGPVFMQIDAVIGLDAVTALAVFTYSLPALAFSASPFNTGSSARWGCCLCLLLIAADAGFGGWRLARADKQAQTAEVRILRLRLVQPAISQAEKQSPHVRERNFTRLLALSRAAPKDGGKRPDLIIWPETSMPYLPDYNPAALARISRSLQPGQMLLAGAVRVEERQAVKPAAGGRTGRSESKTGQKDTAAAEEESPRYRFYNSMLLIDSAGYITAYADKKHLVPFGEYLPLPGLARFLRLQALAAAAAGPYSAAGQRRLITLPGGAVTILPLICYEAIFPRESRAEGAKQADIIINTTNDAWFGNTPGPRQHLAQVRLRAVEQQRPLIRVANSGISAYIDAYGRLRAALPLNASDFLDIDVPLPLKAKP